MKQKEIQQCTAIDIEEVADRLGMEVKRHKALCPFHDDKHPSLSFRPRNNTYRCFVCGAHGDAITLVQGELNVGFLDACHWLADAFAVELERDTRGAFVHTPPIVARPSSYGNIVQRNLESGCTEYNPQAHRTSNIVHRTCNEHLSLDLEWLAYLVQQPVLNDEACSFLFGERRLNPAVIRWLGISSISQPTACWRYGKPYFDAPSLLIPYRDINGKLLSVQSRYLGNAECKMQNAECGSDSQSTHPDGTLTSNRSSLTSEIPRFRFPKGSHCPIYNLPILKLLKPGEPLYISEGVTDCMALLSSGHKAIAIPSATLLHEDDLQPLAGMNLHMYPDNDEPGQALYQQLLGAANRIGACLTRHDLPSDCKDYSEMYLCRN